MFRHVLAVAAVPTACGVVLGQARQPDPDREKKQAEAQKRWDKYLEKHPTEVPDLVGKIHENPPELPKVEVGKDDSAVVKAAKRAIQADRDALQLMQLRINSGGFPSANIPTRLADPVAGMYASAQLIWDDPEKLLPFAEFQLSLLASAERGEIAAVERGVMEPQVLSQRRAARCKAEADVLRLREKAKRK